VCEAMLVTVWSKQVAKAVSDGGAVVTASGFGQSEQGLTRL
jgi:hypothetical protein